MDAPDGSGSNDPTSARRMALSRTLSSKSVQSTASSFAKRMNATRADSSAPFTVIGRGTCGTVYEIPGTVRVVKIGSSLHTGLWQDFLQTNLAYKSVVHTEEQLQNLFCNKLSIPRVPRCFEYHTPDDKNFWDPIQPRIPPDDRLTRAALIEERVLPIPSETRAFLISTFFPKEIQEDALENEENKACLIRLYFGENEPKGMCYDTLQNFPLYYDRMLSLDLKLPDLVKEVAIGLSILHWQAHLDGRDVEFVLGTSAAGPTIPPHTMDFKQGSTPRSIYEHDFRRRQTHIWMIDFDKSRSFKLTDTDILDKLVPATHGNDPYFPRPDLDASLWEDFAATYIKSSEFILKRELSVTKIKDRAKKKILGLPRQFIQRLKVTFEDQAEFEANPESFIIFEDDNSQAGSQEESDDQGISVGDVSCEEDPTDEESSSDESSDGE